MALELVSQLLQLSKDPDNRPFIVNNEGTLSGLVMFLGSDDSAIVHNAVETIHNLALYEPNIDRINKEPGLLAGLRQLNPETPLLSTTLRTLDPPKTPHLPSADRAPISAAKTHTFYIKGMTNLTKHKVEETLVSVKGVVSFLIDVHTHKAVVRTMTSPEAVITAIKQAGLQATYGESEDADGKNEPDYLPEGQRAAKKGWGWGSVVSMGKKQQEPGQNEQGGQWGWNSVVKAIWG